MVVSVSLVYSTAGAGGCFAGVASGRYRYRSIPSLHATSDKHQAPSTIYHQASSEDYPDLLLSQGFSLRMSIYHELEPCGC